MGFRFREFSWHVASLSPLLTTRGFLNELIAFLKKKNFKGVRDYILSLVYTDEGSILLILFLVLLL